MSEIATLATEYMVTALPVDHPEAHLFSVWVQWRGAKMGQGSIDRYVVSRWQNAVGGGEIWHARQGKWVWEPRPSERTDRFMAATRYPLERALKLAQKAAGTVTVNGYTPDMVLARYAAAEVTE